MNEHEARLCLVELVRDALVDLADDGVEPITDEFLEAMMDTAEMLLDTLRLEVISVEGDMANVKVWLRPEE